MFLACFVGSVYMEQVWDLCVFLKVSRMVALQLKLLKLKAQIQAF